MRELGDIGKTKRCGAPLDGVRRAENRIQLFVIGGGDVDAQEQGFHRVQMLAGLIEKQAVQFGQIAVTGKRVVAHKYLFPNGF